MADAGRARRMAGRIKQIVATQIETQVKDPRLGMVTITDVRVTGDLHDATVFYTVLGDDNDRVASAAALESAKGVLRSEVGRQTGVRGRRCSCSLVRGVSGRGWRRAWRSRARRSLTGWVSARRRCSRMWAGRWSRCWRVGIRMRWSGWMWCSRCCGR